MMSGFQNPVRIDIPREELADSPVFSEPNAVFADRIEPGDVISLVQRNHMNVTVARRDTVVLDVRGLWFDHLPIAVPSKDDASRLDHRNTGRLETARFDHLGMAPIEYDSGVYWAPNEHGESLGLRLAASLMQRRHALKFRRHLNELVGVGTTGEHSSALPGLAQRVWQSFIRQTMPWGGATPGYQRDIR